MSWAVCLVSYSVTHTINYFAWHSRVFICACIPTHLVHVSLSLSLSLSMNKCPDLGWMGFDRHRQAAAFSVSVSRTQQEPGYWVSLGFGSEMGCGWNWSVLTLCTPPLSLSLPHILGRRVLPSLFWGKYHIMKENIAALSPSPCSADNLFILHNGIGAQTGTDKIRFIKSSCKMLKCDRWECNYFLKCWMWFFFFFIFVSWILKVAICGNFGRWNIYLMQIKMRLWEIQLKLFNVLYSLKGKVHPKLKLFKRFSRVDVSQNVEAALFHSVKSDLLPKRTKKH